MGTNDMPTINITFLFEKDVEGVEQLLLWILMQGAGGGGGEGVEQHHAVEHDHHQSTVRRAAVTNRWSSTYKYWCRELVVVGGRVLNNTMQWNTIIISPQGGSDKPLEQHL